MLKVLPLVIDTIFSLFISFVLALVFTGYFIPHPYSVVLALCLAGIFTIFAFKILLKRQNIKIATTKEQKLFESTINALNFMTKLELLLFFEKILRKNGYITEKKRGAIFIKNKNATLFFKFGFEDVVKADVVRAYNLKSPNDKAYILCENCTTDVKSFASRFEDVEIVCADKIFLFLKENDCLPQPKSPFKKTSFNRIAGLKSLFERKRAKTYALFGITFLFSSFFATLKLYYVIIGGLFLIFSLICLLFGTTPANKNV